MRNLLIALSAVLVAYLCFLISWLLTSLVFIALSLYVFGWLFYKAQLLPETLMNFIDASVMHDGQLAASIVEEQENSSGNISTVETSSTVQNLTSEFDDAVNVEIATDEKQELFDEVVLELERSNIVGQGLTHLSRWLGSEELSVCQAEVAAILQKIREAQGISQSIHFSCDNEILSLRI